MDRRDSGVVIGSAPHPAADRPRAEADAGGANIRVLNLREFHCRCLPAFHLLTGTLGVSEERARGSALVSSTRFEAVSSEEATAGARDRRPNHTPHLALGGNHCEELFFLRFGC